MAGGRQWGDSGCGGVIADGSISAGGSGALDLRASTYALRVAVDGQRFTLKLVKE